MVGLATMRNISNLRGRFFDLEQVEIVSESVRKSPEAFANDLLLSAGHLNVAFSLSRIHRKFTDNR